MAAIVVQGICSILMTLTPFPQLFFYIGFTLNFFALLSVASLFVFRRRAGWLKSREVSFAWPLMPLLFILIGTWQTVYGFMLKPAVSLAAVVTITAGAVVYHFRIAKAAAATTRA